MSKHGGLIWLCILSFLTDCLALGQTSPPSAVELIGALAHPTLPDQMGMDPCSSNRRYRPIVDSLVRQGVLSLPEIERAIKSIERDGEKSEFAVNASWVMLAYARIVRRDALPRLRKMMEDHPLSGLHLGSDEALAASLELTAFVSSPVPAGRRFPCEGGSDPRSVFRQFVEAWVSADRVQFEGSLGPASKMAFDLLLAGRAWDELRAELWPSKSTDSIIGYRLKSTVTAAPLRSTESGELEADKIENLPGSVGVVQFVDRNGVICGSQTLQFYKKSEANARVSYYVDSSELRGTLQMISACASRQGDGL